MHNSIRLETRQVPINRRMDKCMIQTMKYYLAIKAKKELLIHNNKYDLNALCRVKEAFYKEYILCVILLYEILEGADLSAWHKNIRILVTLKGTEVREYLGKSMSEIYDDIILYLDRSLDYTFVYIYICQTSANILKIHTFIACKFTLKEQKNFRKLVNSS